MGGEEKGAPAKQPGLRRLFQRSGRRMFLRPRRVVSQSVRIAIPRDTVAVCSFCLLLGFSPIRGARPFGDQGPLHVLFLLLLLLFPLFPCPRASGKRFAAVSQSCALHPARVEGNRQMLHLSGTVLAFRALVWTCASSRRHFLSRYVVQTRRK